MRIPTKLAELILPGLIAGLLGWIATNIAGIRESLAIAVTKIEDHERRLENLETLFLHPRQ